MRKIFTLLFTLVLSVGMILAEVHEGTCGDNLTWSCNTEDSTLTISGSGEMAWEDWNAPWDSYRENIAYVSLPAGLTNIKDKAFYMCRNLKEVSIPDSVTCIDDKAFWMCNNMTTANIPNSVRTIGKEAFANCEQLASIAIPDSVTSLGRYAFGGCHAATSITIGNGLLTIPDEAFSGCSKATSLVFGNKVETIGQEAFYNCVKLTSIDLPESVKTIKQEAFSYCYDLSSVTIGSNVESIGDGAFSGCDAMTEINVASDNPHFASYDGMLFNKAKTVLIQCPTGKTGAVTVPDGVGEIKSQAFISCSKVTEINMPEGLTTIGTQAFLGCKGLTSIVLPVGLTQISNQMLSSCTELLSVSIPNTVTKIGQWAFNGCRKLPSLEIPNSVDTIDSYAFYRCDSLVSMTLSDSLTSIGMGVFQYCSGLTSVTLPNGLTTLSAKAFNGCSQLKSILLPDSLKTIGFQCFYACRNLSSVELPANLTNIEYNAFSSCTGLTTIINHATAPLSIESDVFFDINPDTVTLYVPDESVEAYRAADVWNDFKNIRPLSGKLQGQFSINATDKVIFSQGNLQYVGTWQFANHQWDYFGESQSDNYRDLFGWGTGDAPNKVSTENSDYSEFTDWGTNAITNGGNEANLWRTLTKDEWKYLFDTRSEASSKYGAAKVNGVAGIVLLPDNWTLPSGCDFTAGMTDANAWDDWSHVVSTNIYDASHWKAMESAGAVFLPAAGYRDGADVYHVNLRGTYWSATLRSTDMASYLCFTSLALYPTGIWMWHYGVSVRLVQDVPAEEPEDPTGVENVQSDNVPCTKVLRDGQLLILHDGKVFNAQGILIQ